MSWVNSSSTECAWELSQPFAYVDYTHPSTRADFLSVLANRLARKGDRGVTRFVSSAAGTSIDGDDVDYTQSDAVRYVFVVLYVVVIVLSLLGNAMVILTVARNRHMRTVTNFYRTHASRRVLLLFLPPPTKVPTRRRAVSRHERYQLNVAVQSSPVRTRYDEAR